jgi:hypothetical protein
MCGFVRFLAGTVGQFTKGVHRVNTIKHAQ